MTVVLRVLVVSAEAEDHRWLLRVLQPQGHRVDSAFTQREASDRLRQDSFELILCERDLSDGTWKDVLHSADILDRRPALIVISRLANDCLWAEVLNVGGDDVLSKPLNAREVSWAISSAATRWERSPDVLKAQMQTPGAPD